MTERNATNHHTPDAGHAPGAPHSPTALSTDEHRGLDGPLSNPRLAELLHAVQSRDPLGRQVDAVSARLSSVPEDERQEFLVRELVDRLPADQQWVALGLAALGIPARTEDVIGLLEPYVAAPRVEPALQALVAARLVLERGDGRRQLREPEIGAVLGRLDGGDHFAREGEPPTRRDLLLQAATVLQALAKDDDDIRGFDDLDMHFARVDVWLRAGMYDQAHSVIASMDELVHLWGTGTELRSRREAVRGRLGDDPESEMMNLAALGDIYSYSGDFPTAVSDYTAALTIAKKIQHREAIRRIHIGMGVMFWEHGRIAEAEEHYAWALGLASEEEDERGDRAAALTGRADCRLRSGNYRQAITDALAAFKTASEADPGLAAAAAQRLTSWYAHLNRIEDALTILAQYDDLITGRLDPSAHAELYSVTADLSLYRGRYREARSAAERAIGIARDYADPVNLRRSLTILALAHVYMGDFPAAHVAIEEAARHRVAGRDSVELALRGIIAHRVGHTGPARDLFQQLHEETGKRIAADANDLPAWDFTGIARCHAVLCDAAAPATALEAFCRARPESADQTPGLDDQVRFMVETLANSDPRLDPVLTELARRRPGRAG
ncbi:tetratricopeptide repeat protein [Streptomyces sp. NPDC057620]|uniref:tetratricopeptide repeat protein n=1 Tax=Streptomyces sp. NPDC057620 TaxID=3346185 RepID=UPI0036CC4E0F